MNLLTINYFAGRKGYVLLGAVCGVGLGLLAQWKHHDGALWLVGLLFQPLITCPYTPKTALGRLWWTFYLGLLASLALVFYARLPHITAWAGLIGCVVCGIVTVCLRWKPPLQQEVTRNTANG